MGYFFLFFTFFSCMLVANDQENGLLPFDAAIEQDSIAPSKGTHGLHSFGFSETTLHTMTTQALEEGEFVNGELGFRRTTFDWGKDASIRQKNFNAALVKFGGALFTFPNWGFDADISLESDIDHFSLSHNTFYRGLVHGAHPIDNKTNLHIGLLGMGGLHYARIFPILGFDWTGAKNIHVDMIFPKGASLLWSYNEELTFDMTFKTFFSRKRLGGNENFRNQDAIIGYRNLGLEVGCNFAFSAHGAINFHIGQAFQAHMTVEQPNTGSVKSYHIKSAPYLGLRAHLAF